MAGVQYYVDIRHDGLGKFRRIKGSDRFVVEQQANFQVATWEEQWKKKLLAEAKRDERDRRAYDKEMGKAEADERTEEAQGAIRQVEGLLRATLAVDDAVDWTKLKNIKPFPVKAPEVALPRSTPPPPNATEARFGIKSTVLTALIPSVRAKAEAEARTAYDREFQAWQALAAEIERANSDAAATYAQVLQKWQKQRNDYERVQAAANTAIDSHRVDYESSEPSAIVTYCELVLSRSVYPEYFPKSYDLEFRADSGTLIVDFQLPRIEDFPKVKDVKFIQARSEFKESVLSDAQIRALYDDALYQISLRTVHELFEADQVDVLKTIVFNGVISTVDKSTGQDFSACIMSLSSSREEFLGIQLDRVEPKECFKKLKGVASSKLHAIAPVRPIVQMNKSDSRFVEAHNIADTLDDSVNIAAMPWQDFEYLIRELFEKHFAAGGGEVKVTRASRDGGVDAVVFDPDPIRGGKLVIQAKRYTATVGVSAVRDLYGTVVNEGAIKGILISTADYGPDAYSFAKDKPLTLLSGANLLHMLQEHGYHARIDLQEAKLELAAAQA